MRVFMLLLMVACSPPEGRPAPCWQPEATGGTPVATVGQRSLTVDELLLGIRQLGPSAGRRLATESAMRDHVEDRIRFELLAAAAAERGLHRDPEVVEAARTVMVRKLLESDLGDAAFADKVAEKAIADYYDRHREEYVQPAKRRIAHIQLAPGEQAQAEDLLRRIQASPDPRRTFRLLAAQHSQLPSRDRGGEELFMTEGELAGTFGAKLAAAAFTQALHRTELVEGDKGLHLTKVLAQRDALTRDLDSVRGEIRNKLLGKRRSEVFDTYLAGLKERFPVALIDGRLRLLIEGVSGPPR